MESNNTSNRIHPLVAAASASVILVSLVGVAAITGVLPNSYSTTAPAATAPAPAPAPQVVQVPHGAPSQIASLAPNTQSEPETAPVRAKSVVDKTASASTPKEKSYAARPAKPTQYHDQYREPAYVAQAPAICNNCGRVESVRALQTQAQPSGVGIAAGAVLGGVLGNQIGGGNGRTLATVAGAVGGGYAGNEVEKRTRSATTYEVRVRMENGTVRNFPYNNQPSWNAGDRVRVVDGYLRARG
jgi:outer membrane lipoprotein SlyB